MKNEIKEILYLEKYIDKYKSDEKSIINGNRLTTPAMLDYLEVKALLDYITNLQEENKMYAQLKDEYENIIDKATEMFNNETLNKYYYGMSYEFEINDFKKDMLNILHWSDE